MDTSQPVYNAIGKNYNVTRSADPWIADKMLSLLLPDKNGLFLDVGCGTGNYLEVFLDKGFKFYGVEPSEVMLSKAKVRCNTIIENVFVEQLPFDDSFLTEQRQCSHFITGKINRKG
ncbi:MAG: methyltransferase domain-containing protein [Bacteroidetes bacterium]|nr:methyltransferase domain-containing protein [Bacteroidota bacterium]